MTDVTQILIALQRGDTAASDQLLPLVYNELRRLAASKLSHERPGQTLQATALVHEAYLRLVQVSEGEQWNGRAHFFGAAAEAMRRILVDNARKKLSQKRGGSLQRQEADFEQIGAPMESSELLKVDYAIEALEAVEPSIAKLVKLRYFAGLSMDECAVALSVSIRTAHRQWTYAKAFLRAHMENESE